MAILLLPIGADGKHFLDGNGDPRSGAQVFVYTANTSTKATLYQDKAGIVNHTNPIVLNSNGQIANGSGVAKNIFIDSGSDYDVVLAPAGDTDPPASPIDTFEDISPINDVLSTLDIGTNDTITGNTSVVASKFNQIPALSNITASAIVTLPAVNTVTAGNSRKFRNASGADVYLQRSSTDTIDGATTYRIPSFSTIEIESDGTSLWMVTIPPYYVVGQTITGGMTVPVGFLPRDGSAVSRTTYAGLFAVIGSNFGDGDGSTTFNVPDQRGRSVIGSGTGTLAETVASGDVNTTNETWDVASNVDTWITGMKVQVSTDDTLPGGLSASTDYWIIRDSATTIQFATTLSNAIDGTAINLTSSGVGNHTVTHTLNARTLGKKMGEETHGNTAAEIAHHNHGAGGDSSTAGTTFFTLGGTGLVRTLVTNMSTGGNGAHNNMPPGIVEHTYIKT